MTKISKPYETKDELGSRVIRWDIEGLDMPEAIALQQSLRGKIKKILGKQLDAGLRSPPSLETPLALKSL